MDQSANEQAGSQVDKFLLPVDERDLPFVLFTGTVLGK
jgi:hypothetical protein